MKILVSAAKTWGHIFPAIAVADEFKKSGHEVVFLGSGEKIELNAIREKLLFLGAKQVITSVLFEKYIKEVKSIEADFIGLEIPDKYVFGFGLDFDGIGRNMPHLYAYNNNK